MIRQLNFFFLLILSLPTFASNTITVKQEHIALPIKVGGTVIAAQQATLSAQSQGRIQKLFGQEGDLFKKGDVLIQLDNTALLSNREAAVYNVQNAAAQYNRELYSPSTGVSPGGMGMPSVMDNMVTNPMQSFMGTRDTAVEDRANLIAKQAQIQSAKSALQQIDSRIRDSLTVAPFDGMITKRMVENGDIIQSGQKLLTFSNINQLEIQADVPARLRKSLKPGASLEVNLDDVDHSFAAKVSRVYPTIDQKTRTVRVKLQIPRQVSTAIGIYATVSVPDSRGGGKQLIAIPKSAINYRGSIAMVMIMEGEEKKSRLVRLGENLSNNRVEVLNGLKPGDIVLTQ